METAALKWGLASLCHHSWHQEAKYCYCVQGLTLMLCALGPDELNEIRLGPLTPYAVRTLRCIQELLGVTFSIKPEANSETIFLACVGAGMKNVARTISWRTDMLLIMATAKCRCFAEPKFFHRVSVKLDLKKPLFGMAVCMKNTKMRFCRQNQVLAEKRLCERCLDGLLCTESCMYGRAQGGQDHHSNNRFRGFRSATF